MSLKVAVTSTAFAGMVKVAVSLSALIVGGSIVTPSALNATRRLRRGKLSM